MPKAKDKVINALEELYGRVEGASQAETKGNKRDSLSVDSLPRSSDVLQGFFGGGSPGVDSEDKYVDAPEEMEKDDTDTPEISTTQIKNGKHARVDTSNAFRHSGNLNIAKMQSKG
jgi:hypothetical protein